MQKAQEKTAAKINRTMFINNTINNTINNCVNAHFPKVEASTKTSGNTKGRESHKQQINNNKVEMKKS